MKLRDKAVAGALGLAKLYAKEAGGILPI